MGKRPITSVSGLRKLARRHGGLVAKDAATEVKYTTTGKVRKSGFSVRCKECGKVWSGSSELEVERMQAGDPCECEIKMRSMSPREILELAKRQSRPE